jgi:hypothetical protein
MAKPRLNLVVSAATSTSRLGFPPEIPRDSNRKENFNQSDVISATGIWQCFYDYSTDRGNTAETPREVFF